jgi:hypothetical protein
MAAAWAGSAEKLSAGAPPVTALSVESAVAGPADDDTCCVLVDVDDAEPEQAPIRARQVKINSGTARTRVAGIRRVSVILRRIAVPIQKCRCPDMVRTAEDLGP